jgi:hypothetical protein
MVEFSFGVVAPGNMRVQRLLVAEDFIKDLGYEIAGRVKVYWLRSGKGC